MARLVSIMIKGVVIMATHNVKNILSLKTPII